jgi:inorganic pyrophosphatase
VEAWPGIVSENVALVEQQDDAGGIARGRRMRYCGRMNLAALPTFASADAFHVVVESPRGSSLKLKYEPKWEAMSVSRPLPLGIVYPLDWGFIPATQAPDGDPLDSMPFCDATSSPGIIVGCRAIGVLQVEQNRRNRAPDDRVRNDRVLAVPLATRRERDVLELESIPRRVLEELEQFAIAVTALEGKDLTILGWGDAATALALVKQSSSPHTVTRL